MKISLKHIGERLRTYLRHKGIGINQFGELTNTSGAQISNILNGKNFGMTKMVNIIKYSDDLNLDWLLKGEGEMILDSSSSFIKEKLSKETTDLDHESLKIENEKLKKEVESCKGKLNQFENAIEYKDMTIEAYKTTIDVLSSSNKDLKEFLSYIRTSASGDLNNKKTA